MVNVTFIVPLRGEGACKDWSHVSRLCIRTLGSISRQTSKDWHCILVCNRRPEGFYPNDKITVIEEAFPTPETREDCMRDKRRKKDRGLAELRPGDTRYVMSFDADDLLHRGFVQSLSRGCHHRGWLITNGFDYGGGRVVYRKRGTFHRGCGSCAVLSFDQILADPVGWKQPHTSVSEYYRSIGKPMRQVGGYPVVHVLETGENYMHMKRAANITGVRSALRASLSLRPMTRRFRRDFNLYQV